MERSSKEFFIVFFGAVFFMILLIFGGGFVYHYTRGEEHITEPMPGIPVAQAAEKLAEKPYEIKELARGKAISITVPNTCEIGKGDKALKAWESAMDEVMEKYIVLSGLPITTMCFRSNYSVTQEIILFVKPLPVEMP